MTVVLDPHGSGLTADDIYPDGLPPGMLFEEMQSLDSMVVLEAAWNESGVGLYDAMWVATRDIHFHPEPVCHHQTPPPPAVNEVRAEMEARLRRDGERLRDSMVAGTLLYESLTGWDKRAIKTIINQCMFTACDATVKLCLDHDHDTGIVRGVVCNKHNTFLRWFDAPESARLDAMEYMSAHMDRTKPVDYVLS